MINKLLQKIGIKKDDGKTAYVNHKAEITVRRADGSMKAKRLCVDGHETFKQDF